MKTFDEGVPQPKKLVLHKRHSVRVQQRRVEAAKRQAKHDSLTPKQKLAKLDAAGHVAKKERAKLSALINN